MKPSSSVSWLSALIAALAIVAAGGGLFWPTSGSAFRFTTLRGEVMETFGNGLYRYDSIFKGAGNQGTDTIVLVLGVPLLLVSLWLYRRGSWRGGLLLSGILAFFLYVYASMALAVAYNELFLVYVALFSASFFAFAELFVSLQTGDVHFSKRLPFRSIAVFLVVCGALTAFVWLDPIVAGLMVGQPPRWLEGYATMVTEVLDLGIILPVIAIVAVRLWRRDPRGMSFAFPVLMILLLLGPTIALQTVLQLGAGVIFTVPEIVGPIAGFLVLGVIDIWIIVVVLRNP